MRIKKGKQDPEYTWYEELGYFAIFGVTFVLALSFNCSSWQAFGLAVLACFMAPDTVWPVDDEPEEKEEK